MFAKVHGTQDIQDGNTGSCAALVNYLSKERAGEGFFSASEEKVAAMEAMNNIDNNRAQIGANEAKFFMLSLNFSDKEQKHLIGRDVANLDELTAEEQAKVYTKLEDYTRAAMDEYAKNFQRENIKSGDDLMYYAKIETQRKYTATDAEVKQNVAKIGDLKPGLQMHVHVIVSRKSKDGKTKLSPQVASKGNEWVLNDKVVKRGFCHENWKINCGQLFDKMFNYQSVGEEKYTPKKKTKDENVEFPADLKDILENYHVTSVTHIYQLMKERGWAHSFEYGQVFEKDGQKFTYKTATLKEYVAKDLSDEIYKDIIGRFNIYEYYKCPEKYNRNGIYVRKTSFSSNKKDLSYRNQKLKIEEKKGEKRINSYVLYDSKTKSSISAGRLSLYSLKHEDASVYDREKYIESLQNECAKEAFNKVKNISDFSNYLRKQGYTVNVDTTKEYKLTDKNYNEIYVSDNTFENSDIRSCLSNNNINTIDEFIAAMEERGYTVTTNIKGRQVFLDQYSNAYEFDANILNHSILRNAVAATDNSTKEIMKSVQFSYNCTRKVNTTFNYISADKKEIVSIDKYDFKKYLNKELPSELMADICERFDLAQFKKLLVNYTDYDSDFLVEETRSIIKKGDRDVPMISYTLTDKKTRFRVSLSELMTYAREKNIRLHKKIEINQINYNNLRNSIMEM